MEIANKWKTKTFKKEEAGPSQAGGLGGLVKSMSMKRSNDDDDDGPAAATNATKGGFAGLMKAVKSSASEENNPTNENV